jgi:hypothetical protein
MATNVRPTLEDIVARYRREAARQDEAETQGKIPRFDQVNLVVRLLNVGFADFVAIYGALLTSDEVGGLPLVAGAGRPSEILSATALAKRERGRGGLRRVRVREFYSERGAYRDVNCFQKGLLLLPLRASGAGGPAYKVALSAKRSDPHGPSEDDKTVIRVKARMSFPLTLPRGGAPELAWRVDMAVVHRLMSDDARLMSAMCGQMFCGWLPLLPETFLAALRLDSVMGPTMRKFYRFRVEAEFLGSPEGRGALRPADVAAAAEALQRLARP